LESPVPIAPEKAPLSLVLAVITSSETPLLLLDGNLKIIVASVSFARAFGLDSAEVMGKQLAELGNGEWNVPQLAASLEATASGAAEVQGYELSLNPPGRQSQLLVLNAHKLDYDDLEHTRVLLSVADVTAARNNDKLNEDLLRERATRLNEVQHRVANSLQIIASIMMQSARKVQSLETKGHLKDAHGRLMAIAAVQRQLAASGEGRVELRSYFGQLCKSLGASMIPDPDILSILVDVDESFTSANVSVSLGLIVTELVINALKHAFPEQRGGRIIVTYQSVGSNWVLKVTDNGIGMPVKAESIKPGLGTSIVEALAKSLNAEIRVENAKPGTSISISHDQVSHAQLARAV